MTGRFGPADAASMRMLLLALGLCSASLAHAQPNGMRAAYPVTYPAARFDEPASSTFQPPVIPEPVTAKAALRPPPTVFGRDPAWKPDWVKQSRASFTYVPGDVDGVDWSTVDVLVGLRRPSGRAFSITPHFAAHFVDGPSDLATPTGPTDIPGTLFDASVDINLALPLSPLRDNGPPVWLATLAASPGWYSDGNGADDAVRVPIRGMVIWNRSPEWSWVLGAVFLDRDDVAVLPAVGFVWTPNDVFKLDALMPRPKAALRVQRTATVERWLTLSGEFGGGQWAIVRDGPDTVADPGDPLATVPFDGTDDTLTLRALNVLIGLESRSAAGVTWAAQVGMQIGREIEYGSGLGDRELGSTALLRLTGSF